ncbi:MAG: hypothetical protein HOW73_29540 [Polyangiaceae bacterium]|nr:hypothetical protein [Polyangiaceae bacterium]
MPRLAVAHQAEGMTLPRMEQKSAEKTGRSIEEWRRAVLDKLKSAGADNKKGPTASDKQLHAAAKYLEDRSWTDTTKNPVGNDAAFSQLLDAQGYSSAKSDELPTFRRMAKHLGSDLFYDMGWQRRTSISYVLERDKKGNASKIEYADPETEPGIVSRAGLPANLGSFVKLLKPGVAEADQPLRYAKVVDGKPGDTDPSAEINIAAGQNMGDYDFDPNAASGAPVDATVVGANPSNQFEYKPDAKLSNESTQYAGYLSERGEPYSNVSTNKALGETMEKYKNDDKFKAYQEQVKKALKEQKEKLEEAKKKKAAKAKEAALKAGGDPVEKGIKTVLAGQDRHEIVTMTSPTRSGDILADGRWGTYAGLQRLPVSTLESSTVKGKGVVTAIDNVFVEGPPTSAVG